MLMVGPIDLMMDEAKGCEKKRSQGCPKVLGMITWVNKDIIQQDADNFRKSRFRRGKINISVSDRQYLRHLEMPSKSGRETAT